MTYMDWSLEQWGEAVAWFARVRGYSPLPDCFGARLVRHVWLSRHVGAPCSERLILVLDEPWSYSRRSERDVLMSDDPRLLPPLPRPACVETNLAWACRLFCYAAHAMGTYK